MLVQVPLMMMTCDQPCSNRRAGSQGKARRRGGKALAGEKQNGSISAPVVILEIFVGFASFFAILSRDSRSLCRRGISAQQQVT